MAHAVLSNPIRVPRHARIAPSAMSPHTSFFNASRESLGPDTRTPWVEILHFLELQGAAGQQKIYTLFELLSDDPVLKEVRISKLTPALKGVGLKLREAQARAFARDVSEGHSIHGSLSLSLTYTAQPHSRPSLTPTATARSRWLNSKRALQLLVSASRKKRCSSRRTRRTWFVL